MSFAAATGTQYSLTLQTPQGPATATITEVAAGIREYALNGTDLVEGFAATSVPPLGAGTVLVPWPNRIRDAIWTQHGVRHLLAITEPARLNAIHGLLAVTAYRLVAQSDAEVTLAATVYPQAGYPYQLDTTVSYALAVDGLAVSHTIRNVGSESAPVALGTHPYLKIGDVPTGDLVLRLNATSHIDVDHRLNPIGVSPVDGTAFDLRAGARVDDLDLDDGFGGVIVRDGRGEHSLTAPDGRRVTLWGDENMAYVQAFTPRNFPVRTGTADGGETTELGQAVAIEPMTAPADAFNSGHGLRWLAPGEDWVVRWGITPTGFAA
ncbi:MULTISPECIES: aldose 1-epimerase family protein [unclassified Cryobacterium]|uniref:aldose 1-epimerase family protein n=1 Tax=unclassified Cryobacterium TaxID=2649013 RepID=UPI00106B9B1D|nr:MULTISPECIES: aldose 1-epimerase family protein [unclassified Cryobacterium]TFC53957.1 aldose epimerase [Cryobacterium sp. TMB3-1-2]TFC73755.1 aldose epimerase [Cryobacterium sp. TMB3-15]TFC77712.1 aldose epimerase [Cryobacterium sp. TMB3-10]TFD43018.1 aldose epimerase [Cryobacterium sp. TMB3-12]